MYLFSSFFQHTQQTLKQLQSLNLSHNIITKLEGCPFCSSLFEIDLSFNHIASTSHINEVIGNVKYLNLRTNKLTKTKGLNKLYSLERLDLSDNLITTMEEIIRLKDLPFLRILNVDGNPVCVNKDYRIPVFAHIREDVSLFACVCCVLFVCVCVFEVCLCVCLFVFVCLFVCLFVCFIHSFSCFTIHF
jgi:hypothetical protein